MTHLRQQILDKIRTKLDPVATAVNGIVSPMRISAVPEEEMPSFTVLYTKDASEPDGVVFDPVSGEELTRYNHSLTVNIVIHFKGLKDPSRAFDALAERVEVALPPSNLDGLAIDVLLTGTDHFIDAQTAFSLGVGRMVFAVTYRTFAGVPDRPA